MILDVTIRSTKGFMPRTKKKSRAELEDTLVAVATGMFAKSGYSGPSLREITKEAGISLPVVYWFFADKRALYEQCCMQLIKKSDRALLDATKDLTDPAEILFAFTTAVCLNHLSQGSLKLIHRLLIENDQAILKKVAKVVKTSMTFKKIRQAIVRLGDPMPDMKLHSLISFCAGLIEHTYFWRPYNALGRNLTDPDKLAEKLAEYVLATLFPSANWTDVAKNAAAAQGSKGRSTAAGAGRLVRGTAEPRR